MVSEGFLEEAAEELRGRVGRRQASSSSSRSVPQVRIAKQLTLGKTVEPKDIAVLTPYNAQAAQIKSGLAQEGVTGVTVRSITKSQGEILGGAGGGAGPGWQLGAGPGGGGASPGASPWPRPQGVSGATCW